MRRLVPLFLLCGLSACDRAAPEPATDAVAVVDAPEAAGTKSHAKSDASNDALDENRMVIRTARLELRTDAVGEAAAQLGTIAERFGGYVERSEGSADGDAFRTYQATLRIPGDRFERAMAALRLHGEVLSESVDSTDVTQQYSDIEAHLRSHRALESRLLALLGETKSVEDALKVESELVRVRSSIETLEGRRKVMAGQVAMSNIEVTLVHPDPRRAPEAQTAMARIDAATEDARDLFVGVIAGLIRIFGAVLPLLLIGGPIAFAAHRGLHRRRKNAVHTPPPEV